MWISPEPSPLFSLSLAPGTSSGALWSLRRGVSRRGTLWIENSAAICGSEYSLGGRTLREPVRHAGAPQKLGWRACRRIDRSSNLQLGQVYMSAI